VSKVAIKCTDERWPVDLRLFVFGHSKKAAADCTEPGPIHVVVGRRHFKGRERGVCVCVCVYLRVYTWLRVCAADSGLSKSDNSKDRKECNLMYHTPQPEY
jgi:hypothetical protein